ncbi:MAG: hypothetical protein AAF399_15800, partial [Bacteroidota bacterium]
SGVIDMRATYGGVSAGFGLQGCCTSCDSESLGLFALQPGSAQWMTYTIEQTRIFESDQGQQTIMNYTPLESGLEDFVDGCEDLGRCGLCCDTYQGEFAFTELRSANSEFLIEIALRKDFGQFEPSTPPSEIKDVLVISFNNLLYTEIFDIPDRNLTQNFTLNEIEFEQVYFYEIDAGGSSAGATTPTTIYFNQEFGIVGFKVSDGTLWSLKP